ncbi:hypothetical protein [Georgenia subflava]|uniref:Uncharacterized protein n=1 Tax=Georgenia subflava TaxID=1622177 RepID=A0A6N7EIX0_9MICO|nr:hypothetical protein [Georgenia subflava]MPV37371.1 hypothetical protein [Georgenia subflava]
MSLATGPAPALDGPARRSDRRPVILAALVLALALVAAVVLLPPRVGPGQLTQHGDALTLTALDTRQAYQVTGPDPGDAVALYTFVNDGRLPVTVRAAEPGDAVGDDALTVELMSYERERGVLGDATPSVRVAGGEGFAVRITQDWPACLHLEAGSGITRELVDLAVTRLGLTRTVTVPLDPVLHLVTMQDRTPSESCG